MTHRSSRAVRLFPIYLFVVCSFTATALAAGPKEKVLYNFQGAPDGASPISNLTADRSGHLYGTTSGGGTGTNCGFYSALYCGTVFELTPPKTRGGSWTEKVLYSFQGGSDGAVPRGGLILDRKGNLYGTTAFGGSTSSFCTNSGDFTGCGTVFRLSPPATKGGDWTESLLYVFQGTPDGWDPSSGLIFDGEGNLYGTTVAGGDGYCDGYVGHCGSVFELFPPPVEGDPWTETILYSFNGNGGGYDDGAGPEGGVIFDQKGNLYGTTVSGGALACVVDHCGGTVFELSPPAVNGNLWTETVLVEFFKVDEVASFPGATVIFDKKGNLYGTTQIGGTGSCTDSGGFPVGCGTIFSLAPPAPGGMWTLTTVYSFAGGNDGAYPGYWGSSKLSFDQKGNLYGTAPAGGGQGGCFWRGVAEQGCGTVFELTPPETSGGAWTETTLHAFSGGSDGAIPYGGVIFKGGVLYGATTGSSATDYGTVFAIVH